MRDATRRWWVRCLNPKYCLLIYVCVMSMDDASMDGASTDDARRLSFSFASLSFSFTSREKSVVRMWLKLQRARY